MTDLPALIERLEAASGPDRELDRDLTHAFWAIFGGDPYKWANKPPPAFTTSIDAALKLAPEGWDFYVDSGTLDGGDSHACVFQPEPRRMQGGCKGAATPALALCIAALRARQQSGETP